MDGLEIRLASAQDIGRREEEGTNLEEEDSSTELTPYSPQRSWPQAKASCWSSDDVQLPERQELNASVQVASVQSVSLGEQWWTRITHRRQTCKRTAGEVIRVLAIFRIFESEDQAAFA